MTRQDYSQIQNTFPIEFVDTLHFDDDDGLNALMVHLQSSLPAEFLTSHSYSLTSHVSAY